MQHTVHAIKKLTFRTLPLSAVRTIVRLYLAPKIIVVRYYYDRTTLTSMIRTTIFAYLCIGKCDNDIAQT